MAIALTMDINDLPSAIRYGNNARVMLEQFEDTLSACLLREASPILFDVTIFILMSTAGLLEHGSSTRSCDVSAQRRIFGSARVVKQRATQPRRFDRHFQSSSRTE